MHRRLSFALCIVRLMVVASIVSSPLCAQGSPTGKGSWIISGNAGLSSQKVDGADATTTSINIAPSGLYFVSPGVAVGGTVSFGYLTNPSVSSTSFGVGPTIRYYFGDRTGKTLPFVSARVAPTWTSNDPKNSTSESTTSTGLEVEGTIGFTHLLVPHVGITGEAYYTYLDFSSDRGSLHATQSASAFGLRFGVTAFVF